MEGTTRPRLHPLLTVAAISVTVFSAVGIGALTGFLPSSHSSNPDGTAAVAEAPAQPAAAAPEAPALPAAPAATPAPKPVKKHVARKPVHVAAAAPEPAPVAASMPPPPPVSAPVPAPAAAAAPVPMEAAAPVPAGTFGVVESVREIAQQGQGSALGPIAGGIAGAILGSQFGHGDGRSIMTIAGAAGGALAGKEVEKRATATKKWEITVRMDDGSHRTITSSTAPIWRGGERVRLVDGALQPA